MTHTGKQNKITGWLQSKSGQPQVPGSKFPGESQSISIEDGTNLANNSLSTHKASEVYEPLSTSKSRLNKAVTLKVNDLD